MIGTELLNLMYGNPYNQMAGAMSPTPTPNVTPKPGAPLPAPSLNKPPAPNPQPGVGASPSPSPAPGTASGPPASGGAPTAQTPPAAQASPPDLAQLYFQLQNRNRSANEIDRGLSLMAASVSTPSMANAIMGSVGRGEQQQDPGQMLGQLMQMRYMQQMMNMPAPGSGGGTAGGAGGGGISIDPAVWAAMPPDARAKMLSDIATQQVGMQTGIQKNRLEEVQQANQALPNLTKSMTDMDNRINIIKNTQEGDSTALENILNNQSKKNAVSSMLNAKETEGWLSSWMEQHQQQWAALTPAEQAVAMQMKQLGGQAYGEAFTSLGGQSRRSTQEVAGIKSGLSQITNLNQPYMSPDGQSGYLPALNQFQDQIHRGMANAYGAAQQLDQIPDNLKWDANGKPLVDQTYLPGGALYDGRGGQWVNNPPPKQGPIDQATYDKLPVGTVYTGPDGRQYRKT